MTAATRVAANAVLRTRVFVLSELYRRVNTATSTERRIIMHDGDDGTDGGLDEACCSAKGDILDEIVANTNNIDLAEGMLLQDQYIGTSQSAVASAINETATWFGVAIRLVGT